jgi:sensor histidine kinase YesM
MNSHSERRRVVTVAFWMLFGAISTVQIQISMLTHDHSWARVFVYQEVVWGLWIPITFAIFRLMRAVPVSPFRFLALIVHCAAAGALGLLHLLAWVSAVFVIVPYDVMNPTNFWTHLGSLLIYQMPLELLLYGLVMLAYSADEASREARERERNAAQLEASLAQARLLALENQTQPHFLFNTLNGISALVRAGQNQQALAMISGLSDLLRYSLDRSGGVTVPLEEEARTAERYLEIQRIRFADRLGVELALAPDTLRAGVPALLLQPLVENAVRHGIAMSDAPGRIVVRAARAGEDLVIEVFNTGRLAATRKNGIGLSTTRARLAELHGERGRLELAEADGGVLTRVTLPFQVLT